MMELWQIASHVGITLVAVVALAVRIEHRLTKIETDITWLKNNNRCGESGEKENASDSEVDKTQPRGYRWFGR